MVTDEEALKADESVAKDISEGAVKDSDVGAKTIVDRAEEANEKLNKVLEETKALVARQEANMARLTLGGRSGGAEAPKEDTMSDKEYADAAIANKLPRE